MPKLTTEYLATIKDLSLRKKIILKEFIKCRKDPIYCIETYFILADAETGKKESVKLYDFQKKAILEYESYNYNLTMKSRQMGFTTVSCLYCAWYMLCKQNMVVNALANKLKTSRKFLLTVRMMLDEARKQTILPETKGTKEEVSWLVSNYEENNNAKESFGLVNGTRIQAESNNPEACRGDTINLLFIDEITAIDGENPGRMEVIWSSAGITLTRSRGKCIGITTPKGASGWYFEQYSNAEINGWNIINAHWTQHPEYSKGMYKWHSVQGHPNGGYIEMLNEQWPRSVDRQSAQAYKTKTTYDFVRDGKIRSPWYDVESRKLGPRRTSCELDCSFAGSGGEVIDPSKVTELIQLASKPENKPINTPGKGMLKSYKQFALYNPLHQYVLAADVCTGDGSDYSGFVILDITTMEIVATYKEDVEPIFYAEIISTKAFEYGACLVIVESQGPGLTVLLELKDRIKYKNLYYHTLKKTELNKQQKRKLGFWQSNSTRQLSGDKIEELIGTNAIKISSLDLLHEFHTWIWDKDGKRRHAPGKHDDLIMALQMALFYVFFVKVKPEQQREMLKRNMEIMQRGNWGLVTRTNFDEAQGLWKDLYE